MVNHCFTNINHTPLSTMQEVAIKRVKWHLMEGPWPTILHAHKVISLTQSTNPL